LIQLVLPEKSKGGVYDFSRRLQEYIGYEDIQLVPISRESVSAWVVGPDDTVLLQMSGYGFSKRGAPLWLLHELERRRKDIKTLGIFFHELYAFGPPWRSSFWLSPVQRYIVRKMAKLSDFWMTNRDGSAQWLRQYAGEKPHAVLPVFSNVGESVAPPVKRLPKIIVFGGSVLRQKTYRAVGNELFSWAKSAALEVHDIGPPISDAKLSETLRTSGVILHGRLDGLEVDQLMEGAMFGLLAYPVEYVTKSGVFAAYCAHGICPILISKNHAQSEGLMAGSHYLTGISNVSVVLQPQQIGQAAWEWYQTHTIERHAELISKYVA